MKATIIKLFDRAYLTGKSKSTGLYTIWDQKKGKVFEAPTLDELKNEIAHMKKLSEKREARQMIADMCGTSFRAAMEDMGLSKF